MIPNLGGGEYDNINSDVNKLVEVDGDALFAYIEKASEAQTKLKTLVYQHPLIFYKKDVV